jgi:adenylate cyclase
MVKFLSQYSKWIIAVFGFLIFVLSQTQWVQHSDLWQTVEGKLIDRRYSNRPGQPPDPNILLVGIQNSSLKIDDSLAPDEITNSPTLQLMEHPWPWDRGVYAAVLEKLMNAGAKVVVFDFVLPSQTPGDNDFAKALLKYKDHAIIGEDFADVDSSDNVISLITPNDDLILPGAESVVGLVNIAGDGDEIIRHAKYHTSVDRETLRLPNLDPRIADMFKKMVGDGESPDNLIHVSVLAVKKFSGKTIIPPDEPLNYIDFQGAPETYKPLPVEQMFVDHMWTNPPFSGGMIFSNKIVIVGPMAEIQHDIHPTPFGEMPGPEVQAQIMSALLHGSWLSATSSIVNISITILVLCVALGICLRIDSAPWKVSLLAGSVVVFFVACQIAFTYHKLVLPMTQPLFCLVVPGAFGVVFQYALEQFERLRYGKLLGRYVSKNVAKMILQDKRSFVESLRGQKKPVTILFSDIRGFTSMTETCDADKLVAQLNEYFGEMVKIIEEKNQGTLQKFIGDAIMAAWGDTYSDGLDVDACRAVTAALQMRPALEKLNTDWKGNPDRLNYSIGIGVNHGEVIFGNIGTQDRTEMTVLGDGVNLAARLESATKQFHADILIGEQTEKLTRDKFIFRTVDLLTVKGKTKPVEVFALIDDRSLPAPAWLEKYEGAVKLYRDRKFGEAANLFETARKEIGVKDYLCEMYIERCEVYLEEPPLADWDGSFKLTEK